MNLWTTREAALSSLAAEMAAEREVLDKAFQQLEYLAQRLDALDPETPFTRISALTTAKARNLAQACYSLALDGLAQESGALCRVWIEATELLIYLRQDPRRVEEVIENKLPKAGVRAAKIESSMRNIREYLNKTAAHLGLEPDSWIHMLDMSKGRVRTRQEFKRDTLRGNLEFIFALLTWTIAQATLCLDATQGFVEEAIAREIDGLKDRGFAVFRPKADMDLEAFGGSQTLSERDNPALEGAI